MSKDTIYRQDAIEEIDEWIKAFLENGHKESAADACLIQDGIIQLPSAQPQDIARDISRIIENEKDMRVISKNAQTDIILCKDCKHRYVDGVNVRFNVCELNHNRVQADDWYCADAERQEE